MTPLQCILWTTVTVSSWKSDGKPLFKSLNGCGKPSGYKINPLPGFPLQRPLELVSACLTASFTRHTEQSTVLGMYLANRSLCAFVHAYPSAWNAQGFKMQSPQWQTTRLKRLLYQQLHPTKPLNDWERVINLSHNLHIYGNEVTLSATIYTVTKILKCVKCLPQCYRR